MTSRGRRREALFEPLTWQRMLLYLTEAVAVFVLLYIGFLAVAASRTGYTWREMDWNSSGHTSPFEFLRSTGVGKRGVEHNGRTCTEYFEIRSRRALRVDCQ